MAGKTATITLGEDKYLVHTFTLGELEEIGEIVGQADAGKDGTKVAFQILRLALRRAEPTPVGEIEASLSQVHEAGKTLMALAGMGNKDADPPQGQETGGA